MRSADNDVGWRERGLSERDIRKGRGEEGAGGERENVCVCV